MVNEQEWAAKNGFVLWPSHPTLLAYTRLFEGTAFTHAMLISIERTVIGTLLTLAMTTITAYIVSRHGLPGRRIIIFCILITILFPGGILPLYLVVKELHLLDSIWSLVVPTMVNSWSVLVLKQFFENLPQEVEESARLDGAGEIVLMWAVMIPLCLPAMAAIGLFTAVFHWNAWFDALLYIRNESLYPMQLLMSNMLTNPDPGTSVFNSFNVNISSNKVSTESLKMAVVVYGTFPILCIYPFLQKYFTKGVYLGAVKG
ncbi:carbohydrate ABC transporter permease [Cohnella soli]|uniref:Carbohydrate ABC transporter permease n=1 Tax=Cohnella soli TaxID=425005 RepID=A0ABW0HJN0_9BACL